MLERLFTVFEEMREDMKIMKRMQTTIYNTIKNQGPRYSRTRFVGGYSTALFKKNFFDFENRIKNDKEATNALVSFSSTMFFSLNVIVWAFVSLVDF